MRSNTTCILLVFLAAILPAHPSFAQSDAKLEQRLEGVWELIAAGYTTTNARFGQYVILALDAESGIANGATIIFDLDTDEEIYSAMTSETWSVKNGKIVSRITETTDPDNHPLGKVERTRIIEVTSGLLRLEAPKEMQAQLGVQSIEMEKMSDKRIDLFWAAANGGGFEAFMFEVGLKTQMEMLLKE